MKTEKNAPRIALDSLGCKLNQAEIEQISRQLAKAGYTLVSPEETADIYILNTCTVTNTADRKSRQRLRLFHRRNPDARLVAIGCYAERAPGEIDRIEGVDLVLGNERKWNLVEILKDMKIRESPATPFTPYLYENARRTRAFIKIQDGCHNYCAYCIVPLVRSREECVPAAQVLEQVTGRVDEGYKEIVLTGTEIGTYNHDGITLTGLLRQILAGTAVTRLRLSSLQPPEITPDLVELWKDTRLCPHFHLSLQSGSDAVLNRMKRRYTTAVYRQIVSHIRQTVPDVAVTTDVIVGFPGETDAEFRETLDFCRQMKFARIHVFPYSPRPGTTAAIMSDAVPEKVKKARSRQMLGLAEASAHDFRQQYPGKTLEVLFEQKTGGVWSGLTGNYIKVYVKSAVDLTNKLLPVKLGKIYRDGVWGDV
jgi:threonylcarbamoyladenosine tRNA methylthiotransferase MtaB